MRAIAAAALAASIASEFFALPIHSASCQVPDKDTPLVPRSGEQPSFDCTKAKTGAARLICADGELAQLDGELGSAFQKRKAQLPEPDQPKFVTDQLAWIKDRNSQCELIGKNDATIEVLASSKPCMLRAIRERIVFLRQNEFAATSTPTSPNSLVVPVTTHKSWTQITSLTDFAKQLKHQWVKYDAGGPSFQTSYIDLASIISEGDTVTVLDLQDWNPPIQVGMTDEHLGSGLFLVRYDCGSTARSMIVAAINFHGHMGSGTPQDGAADAPKEPLDGWHVMQVGALDGKPSGMLTARNVACNYASSHSPQPGGAAGVASPMQVSPDSELAADLANCDKRAQDQSTVTAPSPINPMYAFNPIMLYVDSRRLQQEESYRQNYLANVEEERQQCRSDAEAAASRRQQEVAAQRDDAENGYDRITVETFALDGADLAAKSAKVSISGAYIREDNADILYTDTRAIIMATNYPNAGNQLKVPLLTDDATREFRRHLLLCQTNPASAQVGCQVTILGQATICTVTNEFGATRELPCIAVQDGR